MTRMDKLAEALFDVLDKCPEPELKALLEVVKDWKDNDKRTYRQLRYNRGTFCSAILGTLEEVEEMYK